MQISISFTNRNPATIENRLAAKLNRQPTAEELKREVKRILQEVKGV